MDPINAYGLRALYSTSIGVCSHILPFYARQLTSPTTLGNAVKISTPTNAWEMVGAPVNEGPGKPSFHGSQEVVDDRRCVPSCSLPQRKNLRHMYAPLQYQSHVRILTLSWL